MSGDQSWYEETRDPVEEHLDSDLGDENSEEVSCSDAGDQSACC